MSDRMDEIRDDRAGERTEAEPTPAAVARAEPADPPPDSEDERELITKLVTGADTALLTSRGADGTLHARPLAVLQKDFDGVVRFLVQHPSEKTLEIEADPIVNVSFASRHGYLSIAGRASVVRDDALVDELWNPAAEAWFPQGRDDPRIAVVEVAGDGAEYWAKTEPGVFSLVKAAAAIVTRRPPDIGENRSVAL